MANISDRLPISGDGWYFPAVATSGYTCGACGGWVANGALHCCPHGAPTMQTSAYQCPRCGAFVFGAVLDHACNPPNINWAFYPPVAAPPCHHCYCIDVAPSGERTKPHYRCCQCGDTRVKP